MVNDMMNYQYIEQLLERYWECDTTLEEEQILRSFFSQANVPDSLKPYASLFAYEATSMQGTHLGDDFTQKVMAAISEEPADKQTTKTVSLMTRVAPLLKAAAVVAVVVTVGTLSERTMQMNSATQADADMMATDTYIRNEDITAKIQIIDRHKSEAIARTDSVQSQSATIPANNTELTED